MVVKLRKAPRRELYWVIEDGVKLIKDPIPREEAEEYLQTLKGGSRREIIPKLIAEKKLLRRNAEAMVKVSVKEEAKRRHSATVIRLTQEIDALQKELDALSPPAHKKKGRRPRPDFRPPPASSTPHTEELPPVPEIGPTDMPPKMYQLRKIIIDFFKETKDGAFNPDFADKLKDVLHRHYFVSIFRDVERKYQKNIKNWTAKYKYLTDEEERQNKDLDDYWDKLVNVINQLSEGHWGKPTSKGSFEDLGIVSLEYDGKGKTSRQRLIEQIEAERKRLIGNLIAYNSLKAKSPKHTNLKTYLYQFRNSRDTLADLERRGLLERPPIPPYPVIPLDPDERVPTPLLLRPLLLQFLLDAPLPLIFHYLR